MYINFVWIFVASEHQLCTLPLVIYAVGTTKDFEGFLATLSSVIP